jgi:hypothetical protein
MKREPENFLLNFFLASASVAKGGPCFVGQTIENFVPTITQKGARPGNGAHVRLSGKPEVFSDAPTWETGYKFSVSTAKAGAFPPLKI